MNRVFPAGMYAGLVAMATMGGWGCQTSGKPAASPDWDFSSALPWPPLEMGLDSTVVIIDDYFPGEEQPDSVLWEGTEHLQILPGPAEKGHVVLRKQPGLGMGLLAFWSGGKHTELPVVPTRLERVTFRYEGAPRAREVRVKAAHNGWTPGSPLRKTSRGWEEEWILPQGVHPYLLVVDGQEQLDEYAEERAPNGLGGFNSLYRVGSAEAAPVIEATGFEQRGDSVIIRCQGTPGSVLVAYWNNRLLALAQLDASGTSGLLLPPETREGRRSHLRIWAVTTRQRSAEVLIPLERGVPVTDAGDLTRYDPHTQIMYFLMVDRFLNGDPENDAPVNDPAIHPKANHQGGDLAGVRKALGNGYFDQLGMNTVWLSPITQNPEGAYGLWKNPQTTLTSKFSGYHGYWPIRSTVVDHRFGNMEEWKALLDEAHARGNNVLLDYVANHVHEEHPIYQAHPDWATELYLPDGTLNTERWDEYRLTTWFDTFMPTLDLEREVVYETMTDSALWWVVNTPVDGFRHDATKHIPEIFWRTLTRKIRSVQMEQQRPIFQIGETYGSPSLIKSYITPGMLDAQFDFNHYDAMVAAFAQEDAPFEDLVRIAEESSSYYGAHHLMGNITGNQDRPRFTSLADGSLTFGEDMKLAGWTRDIQHAGDVGYERMRMLQAYLFAVPGIPCIYQGDEIADVGGNDPDNRRMMRFENLNAQERKTREWVSAWAKLRRSRMSMLYGSTRYSSPEPGILVIERDYLDEHTIIWINKRPNAVTLTLIPSEKRPSLRPEMLLAGEGQVAGERVTVAARSAVAVGWTGRR
jgi:cyclomaltodextrinase